jgi:hypothetical protein
MRMRLAVFASILLVGPMGLGARTPAVFASAEVHRLNIVFSTVPTGVGAGDFNDLIGYINRVGLEPSGLKPLDKIHLAWLLDGELRYFARPNFAVNLGVTRLRAGTSQEYLPTIGVSNTVRADITSVPIHAGGAYYFTPYNQGDFQARGYVGAGFMSVVYNRASLSFTSNGVPVFAVTGTNDSPGYYLEGGVHMFFASKLSMMLSALYRSNMVRNLVNESTGAPVLDFTTGKPVSLDVGGIGFRMAVGIGL